MCTHFGNGEYLTAADFCTASPCPLARPGTACNVGGEHSHQLEHMWSSSIEAWLQLLFSCCTQYQSALCIDRWYAIATYCERCHVDQSPTWQQGISDSEWNRAWWHLCDCICNGTALIFPAIQSDLSATQPCFAQLHHVHITPTCQCQIDRPHAFGVQTSKVFAVCRLV